MPNIAITVTGKIAEADTTTVVCGNTDYTVSFTFDSEWDGISSKYVRFSWGSTYTDVLMTGSTCAVPIISNAILLKIGVYAGSLKTTTPASVQCLPSILCESGFPQYL